MPRRSAAKGRKTWLVLYGLAVGDARRALSSGTFWVPANRFIFGSNIGAGKTQACIQFGVCWLAEEGFWWTLRSKHYWESSISYTRVHGEQTPPSYLELSVVVHRVRTCSSQGVLLY